MAVHSRTPIVIVLGATGAGKSKLALQLAKYFGGEIINADAMQMYKGLNIVTNKVSEEELSLVKHHMIDYLDPMKQIKITEFRKQTSPIIYSLLNSGKIPFICGGTSYYIESLLWDVLIEKPELGNKRFRSTSLPGNLGNKVLDDDDQSIPTSELYEALSVIDSERAAYLHSNDRRKIYRSLQIYYQNEGKSHSEFLAAQKATPGGSDVRGPLKYSNVAFLWVDSDKDVLDERCDKRVDKMIERGLVKELEHFHSEYNIKRTNSADYTMGIFQSIGFKEFHDYLLLNEEEKKTAEGQKMFNQGCDLLRIATHKYARRQVRWIKQRLLNPLYSRETLSVYKFDSTDPFAWEKLVLKPATELISEILSGKTPSVAKVPMMPLPEHDIEELKKIYTCQLCDRQFKGILQYQVHLKGKKHAFVLKSTRKFTILIDSLPNFQTESSENKLNIMKELKSLRPSLTLSDITKIPFDPIDLQLKIDSKNADRISANLSAYKINCRIQNWYKKDSV